MANQNRVKFGDTFYLKHETSGQYLVNVENGRYNWPRLGSQEQRVKLELVGSQGEEVISDSYIKIRTTEQAALNNNILGDFGDSHNCYYWQDGYDDSKQGWRITKASGNAGPIVYSDRVHITNVYYGNQRLVPDTKYQGYITTVKNADDWWILEPTSVQPAKLPNSDNKIESNQMANNFTFDPPGFQNDFQRGEEQLAQQLRSRWNEDVNRLTERILQNEPWNFTNQPALTDYYNPRTTEVPSGAAVVPITWTAYPNRIKYEFPGAGQRKHWEYADNGVPDPNYEPKGPRGWQDEYAEWSVTRNAQGQITKVSFTSETREYWYALWDVAPNIVLRLYKQLISEQVKLEDLYLRDASGNPIIDPQTGRPAYNELNEWNNKSTNGLAHLIGTFNSQQGAMFLGAQSTIVRADEQGNPITDASQLVNWGLHGTPNRNSDPFISARVNDLVRSGVRVTLKNPVGIYLQEPNFGTYELPFDAPDGAKPSDYWKVIRGRKRQAGEAYDLILHAVYEVPAELGFTVSDISINGFPIEYGAQIAEILQVAVIGEGIPQQTPARSYGRVASNNLPYPAALREEGLLKVAERSNLNMRIKQGTTIEKVALKARNSESDATIEFVGAPGITVKKTDFREEEGSQIFLLTITAAADAPPGNRSLLLKNPDGSAGPARFGMLEVVAGSVPSAAATKINELLNKPVLIENQETKRYLFSDGAPIKGNRGDEGGWLASSGFESPKVVGADANYYNRAIWKIIPSGNSFLIENQETKRYLFSDGAPIKGNRGDEGGWLASSGFESPKVVGADANYYNRALWKIIPSGDSFLIENQETKRYLFSDGAPIKGNRGDEGGWLASSGFESPKVVGADANYYNRALWKITLT